MTKIDQINEINEITELPVPGTILYPTINPKNTLNPDRPNDQIDQMTRSTSEENSTNQIP